MAPSVTLMRKIFEKALTIGFVTSAAKPHKAKQDVIRINGNTKLIPSRENNELLFMCIVKSWLIFDFLFFLVHLQIRSDGTGEFAQGKLSFLK